MARNENPPSVSLVDLQPGALLRRKDLALALTSAGFPMTMEALETRAYRGNGPAYRYFGKIVLYRWGDALDWAESLLTEPVRRASEGASAKAALEISHAGAGPP